MRQQALAVVLAVAAGPTWGQAWSFEQVARRAVLTHPAVSVKRSSSAAANAELTGASWQRYPTPSVELGEDYRGVRTTVFRVQQPLWAGGRITAAIEGAQSRYQAAETAVAEAQEDIVFRVITSYAEADRQQDRRKAILQGVEQHEGLLGLIARRVEKEASPRVDRDLAESRLHQARNDLATVQQSLAIALAQLTQLAGDRIGSVTTTAPEKLGVPMSRDMATDQAVAWSATLRRLKHEQLAARADVDAKRAAYLPQLSLRYENGNSSGQVNGIPGYSTSRVLVVLEANPGAGLSAFSGVEAAKAREEAIRQQHETALRELQERVANNWEELVGARTRLGNARLASSSAREVYDSYTRQYTAGRKTWLDVLNAVRESTQAEVAVADARAQLAAAAWRLQTLTGDLPGIHE